MILQLFRVFFIGILFSIYANAERLGRRGRRDKNESGSFPRIYSSIVSSSESFSEDVEFVASLDILGVTQMETNDLKVTFLVHSRQELINLQQLLVNTTLTRLEINDTATRSYRIQANGIDNSSGKDQRYSTIPNFSCYRDLAGMELFMQDLVSIAESVPNLDVTLTDIGDSFLKTQHTSKGHDIWALNITGISASASEKGVLFLMSGLHAREYAPPELLAQTAEYLVNSYGWNADVTAMLDHVEIHIVLHANPDGRVVAESSPHLYRRKNMNGLESECGASRFGVDLNRNFPFRWGLDSGSSSNKCSQTYRGEAPASEPEVQAIVKYVSSLYPAEQRKGDAEKEIDEPYPLNVTGVFLDVHSFGNIVIFPWGHENKETANHDDLVTVMKQISNKNNYRLSGPSNGFAFQASGPTDDWAYGTLGVAAGTLEIGTTFYESCNYFEESIVPVNIPTFLYAAKISSAPFLLSKGPEVTNIQVSPSASIESIGGSILSILVNITNGGVVSSNSTVESVQLFVDQHPYDMEDDEERFANAMEMNTRSDFATLSLTLGQLYELTTSPLVGRHSLYIQATNSLGYTGPVTAAWFYPIRSVREQLNDNREL